MAQIHRVGDPNTEGAKITGAKQSFVSANSIAVATDGDPVEDHPPLDEDGNFKHTGVTTANGRSFLTINGYPVNVTGNADTCGHERASINSFLKVN